MTPFTAGSPPDGVKEAPARAQIEMKYVILQTPYVLPAGEAGVDAMMDEERPRLTAEGA